MPLERSLVSDTSNTATQVANTLAAMKLPELKEAAGALGIKGTSAMKKADLVAAITSARGAKGGARSAGAKAQNAQEQEQPRTDAEGAQSTPKSNDGDEIGARLEALSRNRRSRQRSRSDDGESTTDGGNEDTRSEAADHSGSSAAGSDDEGGANGNRRRRRQRDRNNRNTRRSGGGDDRDSADPTVREDDVLLEIAGILDVLENYAFVRTSGYLPGPSDAYVSLSMVRKFDLRKGDVITGAVRQPRDGERAQKYQPLVRLDKVNGVEPEAMRGRPEFAKLTPLYPQERLRLETTGTNMAGRIMDLMSPIGKGQRGLIVSPPKAGKTMIMQSIANSITTNNPEVYLMVVLVDERPEEVTDFQRTTTGEVIASTFDRPAEDHTTVAELAVERAKRLVELGHDVVILLDGITRLGRAYNQAAPASGRILSGGVDSAALYPPKKFFGAARNIENGGSLTILATALVETGSKMDEVIFEEFKGTGNMELRLSRQLADKRIFPAVDVDASGTRREELLMNPPELKLIWGLRRGLAGMEDQQALEVLLSRMRKTQNNAEFLMMISKSNPGAE
jgi:transcription termination factor Rho